MTFTRKAAAEMRERVIAALRDAADGAHDRETLPATSAHAEKTRALATAALARDRALGWELVAHPARLAIYTIDAFCASIVRQAPIATGLGSLPRFEEHAAFLYGEAARETLAAAPAADADWRALLAHLDNDAERVVALLASMLGKRDQWLRHLGVAQADALRQRLEGALQQEIDGELERVRGLFAPGAIAALARCAAYASANLARDGGDAMLAAALGRCATAGGVPPAQWQKHDDWRTLANWLLVKDKPRFRKSIDTRGGIPAKGSGPVQPTVPRARTRRRNSCARSPRRKAWPTRCTSRAACRRLCMRRRAGRSSPRCSRFCRRRRRSLRWYSRPKAPSTSRS